jgi:hypothetical protein
MSAWRAPTTTSAKRSTSAAKTSTAIYFSWSPSRLCPSTLRTIVAEFFDKWKVIVFFAAPAANAFATTDALLPCVDATLQRTKKSTI